MTQATALSVFLFVCLMLPSTSFALSEKTLDLLAKWKGKEVTVPSPKVEDIEAAEKVSLPSVTVPTPVKKNEPKKDKVWLRNGDVLSGKLVSVSGAKLTFSAYGNKAVILPWGDVLRLETANAYSMKLTKGSSLKGSFVFSEEPEVFVAKTQLGDLVVSKKEIAKVETFEAIAEREKADVEVPTRSNRLRRGRALGSQSETTQ